MVTLIEEPVEVSAVFRRGRMMPVSFAWRNRRYRVVRIAGAYRRRKGHSLELHYSVLAEGGEEVYELRFSTERMAWWLERIHAAG
jgi:hypothetical protein